LGRPVTEANAGQFAAALLDSVMLETAATRTDSGLAVVSVRFTLVPDHLRRRMAPYLPLVRQSAARFGLSEAHVLATIHTESAFNPMAVSAAHAIGLMQLVPETGGAEAYRLVSGREGIPSEEYLFDPANNIRLGCAYIHLLARRYFASVNDSLSRLYCTIAGYNGGPAGVAVAFVGQPRLEQAVPAINAYTSAEGVYRAMQQGLPLVETRQYLTAVRTRMGLYR
jgi:membrane-bound lytic murein transglycosylase C